MLDDVTQRYPRGTTAWWTTLIEQKAIDEKRTRLVSRSRVRPQSVWARLFMYVIEPAGFLMTGRMLLGLKQRAEALRAADTGKVRANQMPAA